MEKHNTKETAKWIKEGKQRGNGKTFNCYNQSIKWIKGLEVKRELTERPHKFTCGTDGHVLDELTIKIKFPKGKVDIQPHDDFAETVVDAMLEHLAYGEFDGYIDISADAEDDLAKN